MIEAHLVSGKVVPYIGTWIETLRGFYWQLLIAFTVVPYIGTWIETLAQDQAAENPKVVPYIGTWIETTSWDASRCQPRSYLI